MASRRLVTLHPCQEAERDKCQCSACFSLFFHPSPSTGNRDSHMWAALPTSKNLIYRCLTDRTRRFVATPILNPIKLTIEMNLSPLEGFQKTCICVPVCSACEPAFQHPFPPLSVYSGLHLYHIVMSASRIHDITQRVQSTGLADTRPSVQLD